MNWAMDTTLMLLTAFGLAWVSTRARRRLRDPQQLLATLHKGQLNNLDDFLASKTDLLEDDELFWSRSGGISGLIRRRRNAVCLVQLCQHLCSKAGLEPSVMQYLSRRAFLMSLMIACSAPGALIRIVVVDLPHVGSLAATKLYWDIELRAKTLCRDYREFDPALADQILALL